MKGKWFVTTNTIASQKVYQVARLIDKDKVDHAGNREFYGPLYETAEDAQGMVERLNKGEVVR